MAWDWATYFADFGKASEKSKYRVREAAKKVLFLGAGPLRGGWGLNGCATKEKRTFFNVRKKVPKASRPGGGAKGLSGRATKKITFICGFP